MATRTKTTWWCIGPLATASVASATQRTYSATTITVSETNSRTFRSAIVEVHWSQTASLAASITAISGGLTVNATRTTSATAGTWTNSGESTEGTITLDFTAGVQNNFGAGSTQSFTFDITITGISTNNVSAFMKLTYDYADTDSTHCKTVILPLESRSSADSAMSTSTSNASIGGIPAGSSQIPILNNLLVENTPTVLDYFILLYSNENTNAYTSGTPIVMYAGLDGSYTTFGSTYRDLGSDCYTMYALSYKSAVPSLSTTHDLRAYCATASHHHLCALLVVTYSFVPAASTAALNSVQIPFQMDSQGGTAAGDAQVFRVPIDIQEPDTVALVNSGAQLFWGLTGVMTTGNYLSVAIGAQTARNFTSNIAAASACGGQTLIQRFDSSGISGAGATLARGQSYVDVKVYCGAQVGVAGLSGMLYLNYTSGVAAGTNGIAKHNHTIYKHLKTTSFTLATNYTEITATSLAPIADTLYWLQSAGIVAYVYWVGTTNTPFIQYFLENLANDGRLAKGDGWEKAGIYCGPTVTETGTYMCAMDEGELFKRHPSDPLVGARDITASRKYRYVSQAKGSSGFYGMATYHAITYTASGNVTGYAGTGAVTVNVHDTTSGEELYTFTASAGGAYTATIYDNTRDHYSEVFEDTTHVGRSANWKAS